MLLSFWSLKWIFLYVLMPFFFAYKWKKIYKKEIIDTEKHLGVLKKQA